MARLEGSCRERVKISLERVSHQTVEAAIARLRSPNLPVDSGDSLEAFEEEITRMKVAF